MTCLEHPPCLNEFPEEVSLPDGVLGPPERFCCVSTARVSRYHPSQISQNHPKHLILKRQIYFAMLNYTSPAYLDAFSPAWAVRFVKQPPPVLLYSDFVSAGHSVSFC